MVATFIYPFANVAFRAINQTFGPKSASDPYGSLESPYPYGAHPPLYDHYHRGVDFRVPAKTPLLACAAGTIAWAALDKYGYLDNGGYGLMIEVDHGNNVHSLCAHMTSTVVHQGDTVTQGQLLGLSGGAGPPGFGTTSGNSSGEHLHFGITRGGSVFNDTLWENPIKLLDGAAPVDPGGSVPPAGSTQPGYVSPAQAAYYALQAGVPANQVATAVAIALAESSLKINTTSAIAPDGTVGRGLWQIESSHTQYDAAQLNSNPAYNAKAMADLSAKGSNWHPWTTFGYVGNPPRFVGWGQGSYKTYLPVAEAAVAELKPGQFPTGTTGPGSGTASGAPNAPYVDTTPELPLDVAALIPVTINRSRLTRRDGLTPTAAVQIAGAVLPVESVSITSPAFRVPGQWTAHLHMSSFDTLGGKRALADIFAKKKTQVIVLMGYVPAPDNRPDPISLAGDGQVFTGLVTDISPTYKGDWVTLTGPDLSGVFSQAGDTASKIDDFMNMDTGAALQKIVRSYAGAAITLDMDPLDGTVGGLFGDSATQTRTPIRTAWDLIVQLATAQGCACYFSGSTLVIRRVFETAHTLRLPFRRGGTLMEDPDIKPQRHSKRDFLVSYAAYNTRAGRPDRKTAGNADSADIVNLFAGPNTNPAQLQKLANSALGVYSTTEYHADLSFVAPIFIAPGQPVVIAGSSGHAIDDYLIGDTHPFYLASQTTAYTRATGLRMTTTLTNRPPGIVDANQAASA